MGVNSIYFLVSITSDGIQIDDIENFLCSTEQILHSNHYLRLIGKRYLMQLLNNDMLRKAELCRELLEIFDKLDPGWSFSRGMTLYELFKATNDDIYIKEILNCLHMEPPDTLAHKFYLEAKQVWMKK